MRGIVIEKENGHAIIMTKKGEFIKIKGCVETSVGEEYVSTSKFDFKNILFLEKSNNSKKINSIIYNKRLATVAASLVLVFGMSTGVYAYASPSNYINIDINPSVELISNRFNRIINVKALNEDGTKLIEGLSLGNKTATEAVKLVMEAAKEDGYLEEPLENEILITVTSKNEDLAKDMETVLSKTVEEEIAEKNLGNVPVSIESAKFEDHKKAEELGISPGKLNLIQKLEGNNSNINYGDYSNMPVKDIMKAVKENRNEEKDQINDGEKVNSVEENNEKSNTQYGNGNNNGNGQDKEKKQGEVNKKNEESNSNKKNSGNGNNKNIGENNKNNNGTKNEKSSNNGQNSNNSNKDK